jgi:hypothetical protein
MLGLTSENAFSHQKKVPSCDLKNSSLLRSSSQKRSGYLGCFKFGTVGKQPGWQINLCPSKNFLKLPANHKNMYFAGECFIRFLP